LLVGGNVFTLPVSAYDWLGVDGVAKSAEEALRMSENWVAAARP
jgi:hypothetical protein